MANVFDAFDPPAPPKAAANPFDAFDEQPATTPPPPGMLQNALRAAGSWAGDNIPAALKLGGRAVIRAATGPADLGTMAGQALHDKLISSLGDSAPSWLGGHTTMPPLPSDEVISATHTQMDPNAGALMRTADAVAPFLIPVPGGAISRVGEAAGLLNKGLEAGRFVAGGLTDYELSKLGGDIGQQYGGDTGGVVGSLIGGGIRPVAARGGGAALHALGGAEDSGGIFDAMTSAQGPNVLPTFGQVAGDSGSRLEKAVGSLPGGNWTIDAARNAAESGIQNSANTGLSILGGDAIRGPVDKDVTAARIGSQALATNQATQDALSAEQQQLESGVGRLSTGQASPVVQTIADLSRSPGTGVNISRSLDPRAADLQAQIARTTDPTPVAGTVGPPAPEITYGGAKDLRSDLRDRAAAAPPLTGHYLGETEDAYTNLMRNIAQQQGYGDLFDAANQRYAQFKNIQQPWLEKQGGELGGTPRVPASGVVSGIIGSGTGSQYLNDLATHISPDVARSTLADVLSRIGQQGKEFSPAAFGKDYGAVNQTAKDFIAQNAAAAEPYLSNAATGGRAFDIQPERPGLSKSLGWLYGAASMPGLSALTSANIESPALIRAMAGRSPLASIMAQLAMREGLAAQNAP